MDTTTATVTLDTLARDNIPGLVAAIQAGDVLLILGASLALLTAVLHFGPLRRLIESSSLDWVRPLLLLIASVVGAGVTAAVAGSDVWGALSAGAAMLVGAGAPLVSAFIRDVRD